MDEKCRPDAKVTFEDVMTSNCLRNNIFGSESGLGSGLRSQAYKSLPRNIINGYTFVSQIHNKVIYDLYGDDDSDNDSDNDRGSTSNMNGNNKNKNRRNSNTKSHVNANSNSHSVKVRDTRDEHDRYRMHHYAPRFLYEYYIDGDYPQDW